MSHELQRRRLHPDAGRAGRLDVVDADKVISGKTEARLNLLAIRRVQLRIDRELKKAARDE